MSTLHCSACGDRVAVVRDERFGMAPAGCICPRCSHPALL